jgi:hypothetical protein
VCLTPCLVAHLHNKLLSQATVVQVAYKFMLSLYVLRFDHLLFAVCSCTKNCTLWMFSFIWDVAWCGMFVGYGTTSQRNRRSELPHNNSLKPHIFHCCFLFFYLKYTLKVVCRKHATSINMLLYVLILCGLMLSLCSLLVHDFHYSSNKSLL